MTALLVIIGILVIYAISVGLMVGIDSRKHILYEEDNQAGEEFLIIIIFAPLVLTGLLAYIGVTEFIDFIPKLKAHWSEPVMQTEEDPIEETDVSNEEKH